jgi:NUMOD3 motif-containing protein
MIYLTILEINMSHNSDRNPKRTYRVFYATHGYGPWDCYDATCDQFIERIGRGTWDGNVHHVDEDAGNDVPENLVVMHAICHQRWHGAPDERMRRQISAKLKGRPSPTKGMTFSAEVNARKAQPGELNGFYGKTHDATTLTKMRTSRRRVTCDDCNVEYAVNWITRHKKEGRCTAS